MYVAIHHHRISSFFSYIFLTHYRHLWRKQMKAPIIYTIYKKITPFSTFGLDFFSKISLIFNTNNTCNKLIKISLNIKTNVTNMSKK